MLASVVICAASDRESDDFLFPSDTHLNISFFAQFKKDSTRKVPQKCSIQFCLGIERGKKMPFFVNAS